MGFLRRFRDPPPQQLLSEAARAESIAANVSRVLGSQRGYSSFLPEFGLGTTWHRPVTPRTLELLRQEILAQVRGYEERLLDPDVETLPRAPDGVLRFRVTGRLADGSQLRLLIQLGSSRRLTASVEPLGRRELS
jgi:predicted component of type VI protein secretion system